ncbi:MAG: type III secretion system export apparatus subunit SctR [Deltaproteobacteria bacterium]|nr:type III secretion system export apparatus subunit SctR [Deltaproteobacteria bacterium]
MSRLVVFAVVAAFPAAARAGGGGVTEAGGLAAPSVMLVTLAALALVPFVIMMATSFVKISVVLSIVRNALGTQQIPPAPVVTGLAVVLTMYVMWPVASDVYSESRRAFESEDRAFSIDSVDDVIHAAGAGKEPLREFLKRNAGQAEVTSLAAMAEERWKGRSEVSVDDFIVLIPAFVLSQLKEGFRIGFMIYIPFLVVDLLITNVLLALGMSMLSPAMVSVPVKILIFIASDGWALIARGLVSSFKG